MRQRRRRICLTIVLATLTCITIMPTIARTMIIRITKDAQVIVDKQPYDVDNLAIGRTNRQRHLVAGDHTHFVRTGVRDEETAVRSPRHLVGMAADRDPFGFAIQLCKRSKPML